MGLIHSPAPHFFFFFETRWACELQKQAKGRETLLTMARKCLALWLEGIARSPCPCHPEGDNSICLLPFLGLEGNFGESIALCDRPSGRRTFRVCAHRVVLAEVSLKDREANEPGVFCGQSAHSPSALLGLVWKLSSLARFQEQRNEISLESTRRLRDCHSSLTFAALLS